MKNVYLTESQLHNLIIESAHNLVMSLCEVQLQNHTKQSGKTLGNNIQLSRLKGIISNWIPIYFKAIIDNNDTTENKEIFSNPNLIKIFEDELGKVLNCIDKTNSLSGNAVDILNSTYQDKDNKLELRHKIEDVVKKQIEDILHDKELSIFATETQDTTDSQIKKSKKNKKDKKWYDISDDTMKRLSQRFLAFNKAVASKIIAEYKQECIYFKNNLLDTKKYASRALAKVTQDSLNPNSQLFQDIDNAINAITIPTTFI